MQELPSSTLQNQAEHRWLVGEWVSCLADFLRVLSHGGNNGRGAMWRRARKYDVQDARLVHQLMWRIVAKIDGEG